MSAVGIRGPRQRVLARLALAKGHLGIFNSTEVEPDLTQAEEVEVIDEEGRKEDDEPAEKIDPL